MTRQLRPSPNCLNCGAVVTTRFCAECGQENTDYRVSLGRLVGDLFEELFQLESRLWRTLWTLVRRPGLLTVEYNAGRRVRYTTPLRLYLVCSVVYFFVGSVMPRERIKDNVKFDMGDEAQLAQAEQKVQSPLVKRILERVRMVQKDPTAATRRAQQAVAEYAPKVSAVLVPLFAFMTWLFFRRPKLYFVEHLVFALHTHATAFLLLLVGELLRFDLVGFVMFAAMIVLTFMAMRRVFGRSRWSTLWRSALIAGVYSVALGAGVALSAIVGVFGFT